MTRLSDERICRGREFQLLGEDTQKAREAKHITFVLAAVRDGGVTVSIKFVFSYKKLDIVGYIHGPMTDSYRLTSHQCHRLTTCIMSLPS